MKITNLRYWIVAGDVWNWTFLKLYTDEGLTGVGEATLEYSELAPFKPMFFEEPIPPYNLDQMACVREHSPIPLATGERIYTQYGWREALNKKLPNQRKPIRKEFWRTPHFLYAAI